MADLVTCVRLALGGLVLSFALAGSGPAAAFALVAGGLTDVLDGRLARSRGPSAIGAHLDAAADVALLSCTAAALEILQPVIVADNSVLLLAVALTFVGSLIATWVASGRLVDPRQASGKIAGGLLYVFALTTLATGVYSAVLLALAVAALLVSSLEAIFRATVTIQTSGTTSAQRSHTPHIEKGVNSSTSATSKSRASTDAATSEPAP